MLKRPQHRASGSRKGNSGMAMIVSLIVLVVMSLAAVNLVRSMDTTNLIAGNMAFKQAATHSADVGVETAIKWLEANNSGSFLDVNIPQSGYTASTSNNASYPLGEAFWSTLAPSGVCNLPLTGGVCAANATANSAGNKISFMVQRLCNAAGNRNGAGCAIVGNSVSTAGGNEGTEGIQITGNSASVYYRITVRVQGPHDTVSYVQSIVSM